MGAEISRKKSIVDLEYDELQERFTKKLKSSKTLTNNKENTRTKETKAPSSKAKSSLAVNNKTLKKQKKEKQQEEEQVHEINKENEDINKKKSTLNLSLKKETKSNKKDNKIKSKSKSCKEIKNNISTDSSLKSEDKGDNLSFHENEEIKIEASKLTKKKSEKLSNYKGGEDSSVCFLLN